MELIKDPMNLVDAFLLLRERLPALRHRLKLVYLGAGSLREQALARLADAGAAEDAWLPGNREDVPALMRSFDVFALPSRNEGISNTSLEAMASGLPVVATEVGGNAELVEVGRCGAVVPHSDPAALAAALEAYVVDPALRARHGERARERVLERFSMEAMVDSYLDVYDAVCPRGRLGHAR